MPSEPIELPPEVAKAFLRDMRAFRAEKSPIKRDEIASRQIHVLRQYQGATDQAAPGEADVRGDEGPRRIGGEFACARPEVAESILRMRPNIPDVIMGSLHSFGINALVISNRGRTPAFPIEVRLGYTIGDVLPEVPIYPLVSSFSVNFAIESESISKSLTSFEFDCPPDTYEKLRESSTKMWFYCNLIYMDFMQNRHEACFCWERWQTFGAGGFRSDPTPAYNKKT